MSQPEYDGNSWADHVWRIATLGIAVGVLVIGLIAMVA